MIILQKFSIQYTCFPFKKMKMNGLVNYFISFVEKKNWVWGEYLGVGSFVYWFAFLRTKAMFTVVNLKTTDKA